MRCSQCGADNPGDTRFCGQCGASLFGTGATGDPDLEEAPTRTLITPTKQIRVGANFAGRYHILEELGSGGMGRVYKALDTKVDETIAIKILNPEVAADERSRERFRNELKTTRQISHRHISRVYDFSETDGQAYITMEYVSGEDLKSLIRRVGQLTPGKAASIASQIAEGLAEAHRLGVIHRDLKPHNIMVDKAGNVRIMDFGIARTFQKTGVTDTGVIIGTPEYMSPEQVEGKEADQRSDVYSLGIIMYEMLTGRVPFAGDTPLSVAVKQKTERPVNPRRLNPQIPVEISRVILRCLEKDRELRYQSTKQFLQEMETIKAALPKTDQVIPERKTRGTREITVKFNLNRMFVPVLTLAGLALITFVGWRVIAKRDVNLFAADKPSLAVMHFENNTGNNNLMHWRKALSDLLIADLSQSRFVQVLSGEQLYDILQELDLIRAPSYSSDDLKKVAERGGVRYILVGKMTQAGSTVRLNTTLLEAATGKMVGSAQVEGQGEDSLFSLVDELTTHVKRDFNLSQAKIASDLDAKVVEITTSSPEALRYYNEGMEYHNQGDYTKSIPLMETAVALDPNFAMAYRAMSVAYANLGYQSEADRRLEQAFQLKDQLSERERYYIEADYYRRSEKTYDQAIESYRKLLALYPDDHVGNNNLGVVYQTLEEYDKAIERFEVNRRNRRPNYHSYVNLAGAYTVLGQLDKAQQVLEFYLADVSDHPQVRNSLAWVLSLQGRYDEALKQVDKALVLNPNVPDGWITKGNIYFMRGDLVEARAQYMKLLEINQPIAHYYAKNMLASLSLAQGRYAEAESQYRDGLELAELKDEPAWTLNIHSNLSWLYAAQGRSQEAVRAGDRAVQLARESEDLLRLREALFSKAMVQIQLNDLQAAGNTAAELTAAIHEGRNRKAMRLVHLVKGKVLSLSGRPPEGWEELRQAKELMPPEDAKVTLLAEAMGENMEAAGEPEKAQRFYLSIIDHPRSRLENVYVYARSLYRAARLLQEQGRTQESRRLYLRLLNEWDGADPHIPLLEEARRQMQGLSR